jgi:hypothetical protein
LKLRISAGKVVLMLEDYTPALEVASLNPLIAARFIGPGT